MATFEQQSATPILTRPSPLARVATGNSGLDQVLHGGLPKGRTTLYSGGPGCGKSIMAVEFLVRGQVEGSVKLHPQTARHRVLLLHPCNPVWERRAGCLA